MNNLEAIIKDLIAPALKQRRFKKRQHAWNRAAGEKLVQVISVQKQIYHDGIYSFTINFGIYVLGTSELMFEKTKNFFYEYESLLRARPKFLATSFDWWESKDIENSPGDTMAQINDFLQQKLIPFFDNTQDIEQVLQYLPIADWKKNSNFNPELIRLACAYHTYGNDAQAEALLGPIIENNQSWADVAAKVLKKMK